MNEFRATQKPFPIADTNNPRRVSVARASESESKTLPDVSARLNGILA